MILSKPILSIADKCYIIPVGDSMNQKKILKILPIIIIFALLAAYIFAVPTSLSIVRDCARVYITDTKNAKNLVEPMKEYYVSASIITNGTEVDFKGIRITLPYKQVSQKDFKDRKRIYLYSETGLVGSISFDESISRFIENMKMDASNKHYIRFIEDNEITNEYEFLKAINTLTLYDYTPFNNERNWVISKELSSRPPYFPTWYYETEKINGLIEATTPISIGITAYDKRNIRYTVVLTDEFARKQIDGIINSISFE